MKRGYIYLIGAALAYASMGVLIKFLSHELSPLTQTLYRLVIAGLLSFSWVIIKKEKIILQSKRDVPVLFLMGVFGYGLSIIAFTYAFNYASIANVLFVFSSYPIIVSFLAIYILKEKLKNVHIISLVVLFLGLVLIFNPTHLSDHLTGNLISLFVAIAFAFYIIFSRILTKRGNSAEVITMLSIWIGVLTSAIGVLLFDKIIIPIHLLTYIGIIAFGFLNFIAHLFINKGFQLVKASTGTMVLLLEPIAGAAMGFIFFAEIPSSIFFLGAILIILSIYISTSNTPEVQ